MIGPTINEEDAVEDISLKEAFWHILTMPWKLLFSLVPPRRYYGGWPAFVVGLIMIGVTTFFITEIVSAGGCLMDMRSCIQAMCLVSIGTSLPDIFTSM